MRVIFGEILHGIKYGIIGLMLFIALVVSTFYFVNPYLDSYSPYFEKIISEGIQQPVKIGKVRLGNRGLEPVLKIYNVEILNNKKTKTLLRAKEMQVGLDFIGSLFEWQFKPGLLIIRGCKFSIYQKENRKIKILLGDVKDTNKSGGGNFVSDNAASWFFEQSAIQLEDVTLSLNLLGGETLKLTDLSLKLNNGVLQHDLKISGLLEQKKSQASFKADLKLRGDFLKGAVPPFFGDVVLEGWNFDLNSFGSNSDYFMSSSGRVDLLIKNSVVISKMFRQPMPVNNMSCKFAWRHGDSGFRVDVAGFDFADYWLSLRGGGNIFFSAKTNTPIVDLKLDIGLVSLAKAKLYYPVDVLPVNTVSWLDEAFVSSKKIYSKMVLKGPLDKFPFDKDEGEFLIDTDLNGVDLNFSSDWPQIRDIKGKMIFNKRSLTILADVAKIMKAPTKQIKAVISNLEEPILDVKGAVEADSKDGLSFLYASPLKKTVGYKLQSIDLTGPMKFNLNMEMPLGEAAIKKITKIDGGIELKNNKVFINGIDMAVKYLNGSLYFTDDSLVSQNLQGKLFDGVVKLDIKNLTTGKYNDVTRVEILGSIKMDAFKRAFSFSLLPYVSGELDYTALLELYGAPESNKFKLASNLKGLKLSLPEPFSKKIGDERKLRVEGEFGGKGLSKIVLDYNDQINVMSQVEKSLGADSKKSDKEVGAKERQFDVSRFSNIKLSGNIAELDWGIWRDFIAKLKMPLGSVRVKKVDLSVSKLKCLGWLLEKVSLQLMPDKKGWNLDLVVPKVVSGKLFFPQDTKDYIKGEFGDLYVDGDKINNGAALSPRDLRPMDIKIGSIFYKDRVFKDVALMIQPKNGGVEVNKLSFYSSNFVLDASGRWFDDGKNQSSDFHGEISSDDVGNLFKEFGLTNNMFEGKGKSTFALKWPASPDKPSLEDISGSFDIEVKNGRIINLGKSTENKLGLGRILNMLSLQSLPRRLTLDFSDLSDQGFAFDEMKGDFDINDGRVKVQKLDIDGQAAYVKAYGLIGLKEKNYDLMLSATPKITSSIPLAAAIAGGPVVGVLTFVADKMITNAIKNTGDYKYRITGLWGDPNIEKVKY